MNIAITAGLQLMPPGFSAGLGAWSQANGLSGEATWANSPNAAIVPADQDFGACLEIVKQENVTRIRFTGETPILPGTYLRVSARVKGIAGNLPAVRIAGWPGTAQRQRVTGVPEAGPAVALPGYGAVVEVSAIVATATRQGVNMGWGPSATLGHMGLDLTGPNNGAVRIENLRIEDVTAAFVPAMIDWVDVRDYGAIGDGVTDDRAAFQRADAAAAGGQVLVPAGTYYIGANLTMNEPVRFTGTLRMPRSARLGLRRNFDLPSYADAFGDETEGMKRGLQALLDYSDHNIFDLCGRKVDLTEPLVIGDLVPGLTQFSARRVVANGQIGIVDGPEWATRTVNSTATYDPARAEELRNVAQIAAIEVGSRLTGPGVGREVYVRAKNVATGTLTLSQPLYGGAGTRSYGFVRYRYAFDFSTVPQVDRFYFMNVDFGLDGVASGVMLPPQGGLWSFRDCFVTRPKDRAITSIGEACQGMLIDRCEFMADDMDRPAQDRTSVCLNVNGNDVKIRDNRFVRFGHFCVAAGTGHLITGNHWFQGDSQNSGLRTAGLVLTGRNAQVTVTGNYIDNASIEWTNEHHPVPAWVAGQPPFGGLTLTGNTFLCSHAVANFSWIVIKPHGAGHSLQGLTVMGNVFKSLYAQIDRVERVDTTFANLDSSKMRNVRFEGNTFNGVKIPTANPLTVSHAQNTASVRWVVTTDGALPFNGQSMRVESIVAQGTVQTGGGARNTDLPSVSTGQGSGRNQVILDFSQAVRGTMGLKIRMDQPE
ncbi:glycosyl hydrolase family 28-related protein [Paracoccus sp. (in: a-proteobacteria)]|uniref:glycosyl hydrolase family 28-related protein n=1 Tax=Paracoccus sp. TaxID=267 RepID=UPI0026DFCA01|nr:glycosyl hydrolase family 28-related protein [Paracoccus sp. (in: a-proteobacteria)]MDO5371158.1 glycosyl hydrolase family 28-related protein [Paracoccus sp. (in: a-proteobacteria)]